MRQLNDVRETSELERQLDNALGELIDVEKCRKSCITAIEDGNPFRLMSELAEIQSKIREAMHFAIAAQDEHMKPIIKEASRLA